MDYELSVIFITYNHEKYVEKALRSVLSQETDFPFEVVIGEDISTDATRRICEQIAAEYPEHEPTGPSDRQVRFTPREKNTGRPTLNVYETTMECQGKYLAYLEGDDYWTDNGKLQKQVDFLREHPEYIAVTHGCRLVDENNEDITDPEQKSVADMYNWSGKYTYHDFCYEKNWPGHYASVVSHNIYKNGKFDYTILYRAHDFVDDAVILLFLLIQGDIYRLDDEMSAWRYVRKQGGSNWNSLSLSRDTARDDCYLAKTLMKWMEDNKGLTEYGEERCRNDFGLALKLYLTKPSAKNRKFLRDMYDYGITHVVLHDKKSTLIGYSIRTIIAKLTRGIIK